MTNVFKGKVILDSVTLDKEACERASEAIRRYQLESEIERLEAEVNRLKAENEKQKFTIQVLKEGQLGRR